MMLMQVRELRRLLWLGPLVLLTAALLNWGPEMGIRVPVSAGLHALFMILLYIGLAYTAFAILIGIAYVALSWWRVGQAGRLLLVIVVVWLFGAILGARV